MLKNGNKCRVIILSRKKSNGWSKLEEKINIVYFNFPSYFLGALWLIPHLALHDYKSVSHTFSSQTIINGALGLAKRLGIIKAKVIARESNSIFELLKGSKLKIYKLFYKLGYKGSSLVITQTDYMKRQLKTSLPALTKQLNIQTIPNPFNFKDIQAHKAKIDAKFQSKQFIVAAGRLAPAKGFDILIEAFHEISMQNTDIDLIILGEGAEREHLTQQINNLNLNNRVHMPGYVNNVYSYFDKARACVLSSRIEGFPNVLLQMMSQNTCVIATLSAGGIDEIPNIYTCPTEDKEALKIQISEGLE